MGASLTCGSDANPALLRPCSLIALRAALYLPPLPGNTRCLVTFSIGGMSSEARASRNQVCGPFLSTVCRALRCSTHESFHLCADGFPGRQGVSSFPTLFISSWLHFSFSPAKRT